MLGWLNRKGAAQAGRTCTVTFADGHEPLPVPRDAFLLASALEAGLPWPHNCKVGTCGQCKTRVVSGRIRPAMDFALSPLTADELRQGYVLACQSRVREDLLVDVPLPFAAGAIVRRGAVVQRADRLTPDVMHLTLTLDAPLVFAAGQYVDIGLHGADAVRSYSLCEAPRPQGLLEVSFLIRRLPGGRFSERLFAEAAPGRRLHLRGPMGVPSTLNPVDDAIGVAGGTGLAPMLSLMADRLSRDARSRFTLFLGLRSQADNFGGPLLAPLRAQHPGRIDVEVWLSDEPADSSWAGARGLVTEALQQLPPRTRGAFLCGNAGMVHAARDRLLALGLPSDRIHADAFSPSGAQGVPAGVVA